MSLLERLFRREEPVRGAPSVTANLFEEDFLKKLATLSLMSRRATAGIRRGERRSRKRGSGVEFADHRNYVPGDDIRFLDLGVYRRFGKLLLRLFEEEEDLSLYFLVDTSASMGENGARKLNHAAQLVAALSYIGLRGLDRVGVVAVSDHASSRLAPTRGVARMFRVLRFLSGLTARGGTDLEQAAKQFVAQHRRRGVCVLLSDLYDPAGFEAGLNMLRFNKFEPVVLQLTDPADEGQGMQGDVELFDVETGDKREVSLTPQVLSRLRLEVARRNQTIQRFCSARGVPHFLVDVSTPFDEVVLTVLRAGGLLR